MHPVTIGSLVSAGVMIPLTAWAKAAETGRIVFVIVVLLIFLAVALWRIAFGAWPGDEFH